jgi:hypothetical protein
MYEERWMKMPDHAQKLIEQYSRSLNMDSSFTLLPFHRLTLYDAFGPTYASENHAERIAMLQRGVLPLTSADRARAQLALLTAQHVLPMWLPLLEETGFLEVSQLEDNICFGLYEMVTLETSPEVQSVLIPLLDERPVDWKHLYDRLIGEPGLAQHHRAIMAEYVAVGMQFSTGHSVVSLDQQLAPHRNIFWMPTVVLPFHMLQLAEGLLRNEISPATGVAQRGDIHVSLGNFLGYAEEEFSAQAHDICFACYEALNQALGLGPFDGMHIDQHTTDEQLEGFGAAAGAAVKAYAGLFFNTISTPEFDPVKRRAFWRWWLETAIPQAWALDTQDTLPEEVLGVMPFQQTVQRSRYDTGIRVVWDADAPQHD